MFSSKNNHLLYVLVLLLSCTTLFSQDLSDEWVFENNSSKKLIISQKHDKISMNAPGSRAKFTGTIQDLDSIKLELKIPNVPAGVPDKVLFKGRYYFGAEGGERLDAIFETPQYDSITKQPREPKINAVRLIRNRKSDRIWNFSKVKKVKFGNSKFIDSLYSGQKQLPGYEGRIHNESKAVLIITDYKSSEAMMLRAEQYRVSSNEFKIWLHMPKEEGWVLRSELPPNARNFMNIEISNGVLAYGLDDFLDDLEKGYESGKETLGEALDVVATGTYELMDWTSKGLQKLRIPEWAWNCHHKDYESRLASVYKYSMAIFNPMMPILAGGLNHLVKDDDRINDDVKKFIKKLDDGQVGFAFTCGIWNGVIEIGRSIPELGKLIVGPMSSKGREDFSKFLDTLSKFKKENSDGKVECEGTWCAIKTGLVDAFNPLKYCKFAELMGEITLPLVIAFVGDPVALFGVAEAGAAKVIIQIIRVLQFLDKLGDPFQAFGSSFRFVNASLSKVRNSAGKALVTIDNNVFKAWIILGDEFRYLSRPMNKVALAPSGGPQLMVKGEFDGLGFAGTQKTAKIIDGDLAKKLQGKGISIRKLNQLGKKVKDIDVLMFKLNKSGLSKTDLNNLIGDLTASPDLLKKFNSANLHTGFPELIDTWKIVKGSRVAVRRSTEVLETIAGLGKKQLANGTKLDVKALFDKGLKTTFKSATDDHCINILKKIDSWTPDQVQQLTNRFAKPEYSGLAKELADPGIFKLYDEILLDPENALDIVKSSSSSLLRKAARSTFFNDVVALGKKFEDDILKALKNKNSAVYTRLKQLVPDLDERRMLSQVQFCIPPGKKPPCSAKGEYFIADLVFVKYDANGRVVNMVIADSKLSRTTRLTKGQTVAKQGVGKRLSIKRAADITRDANGNLLPARSIRNGTQIVNTYFYKIFGNGKGGYLGIMN